MASELIPRPCTDCTEDEFCPVCEAWVTKAAQEQDDIMSSGMKRKQSSDLWKHRDVMEED